MPNTSLAMLLSSEFSLTIALVVFVMITLFLVTIIVLLSISKSFRAFFFREHKNSDAEPRTPEPAQAEPELEAREPAPEPKQQKRRKRSDPFGVPTVPLTFQAAEPEVKKGRGKKTAANSTDYIQTIEIDAIAPQSDKTTFITRTAPKKNDKRR